MGMYHRSDGRYSSSGSEDGTFIILIMSSIICSRIRLSVRRQELLGFDEGLDLTFMNEFESTITPPTRSSESDFVEIGKGDKGVPLVDAPKTEKREKDEASGQQ